MTTLLNTIGLVPHGKREITHIDIKGELDGFRDRLVSDLKNLDKVTVVDGDDNDFQYHTSSIFDTARDIKSMADGSDLEAHERYIDELHATINALGMSLIHAKNSLDVLGQKVLMLDTCLNRADIANELSIIGDSVTEELGTDNSLHGELRRRGWEDKHRDLMFESMQCDKNTRLELIAEESDADDMIIGVRGKLVVCNSFVKFIADDLSTLVWSPMYGKMYVEYKGGGETHSFKLDEMEDIFMDIKNPTEAEILTWEMASNGKRYDISRWRDIFNLNRVSKRVDI